MSNIEWTEKTWNPITGCTKVSAGCKNCYAKTLHDQRHKSFLEGKMQNIPCYSTPFEEVKFWGERLEIPRKRKEPTMWFVNSMSDLFHEDILSLHRLFIFIEMNELPHHTFQILTKRDNELLKRSKYLKWTPNIWMGVTVENKASISRINNLRLTPAKVKFISIEPLLEELGELDLIGIDWVIVGGESGKNARPMNFDWVRNIRDQCKEQGVRFFMKQLSQFDYPETYKDFNKFPIDLQIREMPCQK
jgi:protein gp37